MLTLCDPIKVRAAFRISRTTNQGLIIIRGNVLSMGDRANARVKDEFGDISPTVNVARAWLRGRCTIHIKTIGSVWVFIRRISPRIFRPALQVFQYQPFRHGFGMNKLVVFWLGSSRYPCRWAGRCLGSQARPGTCADDALLARTLPVLRLRVLCQILYYMYGWHVSDRVSRVAGSDFPSSMAVAFILMQLDGG